MNLHENGDTFDFDAAVGLVRVGFVQNAQVTSGMKAYELEMCTDPDQSVSQIFSAAMDLGGWGNDDRGVKIVKIVCVARLFVIFTDSLTFSQILLWSNVQFCFCVRRMLQPSRQPRSTHKQRDSTSVFLR
jgi:hypothetical protein